MKAVLISIQPRFCELIASGEKTVEVRKTAPKLEAPFKVYIYCTKKKKPDEYGSIIFYKDPNGICVDNGEGCSPLLTGMVIGEFVCDRMEEFTPTEKGVAFKRFRALHDTCLSVAEIRAYLGAKVGYGWHISNLVIYDEPKPLSKFMKPYGTIVKAFDSPYIQRPPQSWCYVEETT